MGDPKKDMEYIWERIPKQRDGKTIRYLKDDVAYLYYHGFVDSSRYNLAHWQAAFAPFKQPDEGYVLNKEQFLTLRKYRYNARVHAPFDAFKIEEGPWSDKALAGLYKLTIGQATLIPEDAFWQAVNRLKKAGEVNEKGEFMVTKAFKAIMHNLAKKFPSPRAILENEVARLRAERDEQMQEVQKNRDASGFLIGETTKEVRAKGLKELESSSAAQATLAPTPDDKGIEVKTLRRKHPPKKFKG